jgi:hypothetical protein
MDRMASHISHVTFSSASEAFVDGATLDSGERIGVDGGAKVGEEDNRSRGSPEVERAGELFWKIDGS